MTSDERYEALEAQHYRTYRAGPPPIAARRYTLRCPQCSAGINHPLLLSRMPGTTDGPRICGPCIRWNQRWARADAERAEAREWGRKGRK